MYIYIYANIYIYVYVYICMYVCIEFSYLHLYVCIYVYIYMHLLNIYIYIYIFSKYISLYICRFMYIHIYLHTYIPICTWKIYLRRHTCIKKLSSQSKVKRKGVKKIEEKKIEKEMKIKDGYRWHTFCCCFVDATLSERACLEYGLCEFTNLAI